MAGYLVRVNLKIKITKDKYKFVYGGDKNMLRIHTRIRYAIVGGDYSQQE